MSAISEAQKEWEASTSDCPKIEHEAGKKKPRNVPFRKYGTTVAWLDWYEDSETKRVQISRIEALRDSVPGDASRLLSFLKSLCDKHGFTITGVAKAYEPTHDAACVSVLSQKQVEEWYARNGFLLSTDKLGQVWIEYLPQQFKSA